MEEVAKSHEWKKDEKQFYFPKNKPELINIPGFKFFSAEGRGNPNDDFFQESFRGNIGKPSCPA